MNKASARVVITGGAGFLGSYLSDALLERGASVICIDNQTTGSLANLRQALSHPNFRFVHHDITRPIEITEPVTAVVHLASIASPIAYLRKPIETLRAGSYGTFNALNLARQHNSRFVLASTSEVYGDPEVSPQRETYWGNVNPVGPRSVYDESKRFAEATTVACRNTWHLDTAIARIFNTYGPRMSANDGRVVPTLIRQALRGEPLTITGTGAQTRSLCFVTDTVAALEKLIFSDAAGPINLGNPHEITMLELAESILKVTGSSSKIKLIPLPVDDPKRRCPDITKAREQLQWAPKVALMAGLRRTVAWYRAQRATTAAITPQLSRPKLLPSGLESASS